MGISKIEAAQRQLDAAIRLFFADDDWIAIHTLAAASGRILRDLAEHRGSSAWNRLSEHIEKRGNRWGKLNSAANFFKHADKDPMSIVEGFDPVVNDHLIRINCMLYGDLEGHGTRSMCFFVAWHVGAYPDLFRDQGMPIIAEVRRLIVSVQQDMSRAEQLALWQMMLQSPLCEGMPALKGV